MHSVPDHVVISHSAGKRIWEIPDSFWRRLRKVRVRRMRATIEKQVLPVLQTLEEVYLKQKPDAKPRLFGKTLKQVESSDVAIEAALYLFELAKSLDLFSIAGKKDGFDDKVPMGSCGMSVESVKRYYMRLASMLIMKKAGRRNFDIDKFLSEDAFDSARDLSYVRVLSHYNRMTLNELRIGLEGRLEGLFHVEDEFMRVLENCHPEEFLRALRVTLNKKFKLFLKWSPEFLKAVSESLDHNAKILALGDSILEIENPEVVRAIGAWPIKEINWKPGEHEDDNEHEHDDGMPDKRNFVTRIAQVKERLGEKEFIDLLHANPAMIALAGGLEDDQLENMKHYITMLSPEILEALSPLPTNLQVGILDGLWEILGKEYMAIVFAHESGAPLIAGLVKEVSAMDRARPEKIKEMIVTDCFSSHFIGLPPRPKLKPTSNP
ncbi:MAG: hypothetical protein OEY85_08325 [Rhodospirillales bacterium]|nr:hypothetical protein [Rhodospirillales bacterium]